MPNSPYILTPPTTPFLDVDNEVKPFLRITPDDNGQDMVLSALVEAAGAYIGNKVARPLLVTQFGVKLDGFYDFANNSNSNRAMTAVRYGFNLYGVPVPLYYPPLISVDSVKYIDQGGTLQTLSPSLYVVDTSSIQGKIYPAFGQVWPVPQPIQNSVTITFTAGYTTVPTALKVAMLHVVADWYQNRQSVMTSPTFRVQQTIDALCAPYQWGKMQ